MEEWLEVGSRRSVRKRTEPDEGKTKTGNKGLRVERGEREREREREREEKDNARLK